MIRGEVQSEMKAFDEAMGKYIALSRRSAAEVVAQKGGQLILGNNNPPFPGLYDVLKDLSPEPGSIVRDRMAALGSTPRGARRPVKVRPRAYRRAGALLEGRPSGLFNLRGTGGGLKVRQVRFSKRGNKRIKRRGGVARRNTRRDASIGGDRLLNRVSLAIAIELMYREQGRGYTAISFLPKRYRRMLGKARSATRRSAAASRARKVDMNQALQDGALTMQTTEDLRNAQGDTLGRVVFRSDAKGAALRILGYTPPQARSQAQAGVARVINFVRADTMVYVDRKLARQHEDSFKGVRGKGVKR